MAERNQKRPVILINTQHASNGRRLCREVRDRRRQAAEHERQDTRKTPRGGGARGTPRTKHTRPADTATPSEGRRAYSGERRGGGRPNPRREGRPATRERGNARSEEGSRSEEHREAKGREADEKPEGDTKGQEAQGKEDEKQTKNMAQPRSAEQRGGGAQQSTKQIAKVPRTRVG